MINTFVEYTEKIKSKVEEIPMHNKLFWGAWFCESLFKEYGTKIKDFYSNEVYDVIEKSMDVIWNIVDEENSSYDNLIDNLLAELSEVDDSELDQLEYEQDAIYELIISLDAILNNLIKRQFAFLYNVSQSSINVIDKVLQTEDVDLTTNEGFKNYLCIEEVTRQFKMIDWLKQNKASSKDRNLFR